MMYEDANKPIYDYSKLDSRITEKFGTYGKFAEVLGKTRQHVSRIMNNKSYLDVDEIETWVETLELEVRDIPIYFFTHKVHET